MVTQLNPDVELAALGSEVRTIEEWTTTFQLLTVILDPYTQESAWILPTAGRILSNFSGASVRTSWTVTADERDAKRFLGPWADQFMTFVDPDRKFVEALGIEHTPALAYVRQDLAVIGTAQGWQPPEWEQLCELVGKVNSWSHPQLPAAGDPGPFVGASAKG